MKNINFLLILLFSISISSYSIAQDDQKKISVQGFLKDANGKAVDDGEYSITFSIYDDETVGTKLWAGTQTVNVFGGVYSAQLAGGIDPQNNDAAMEIEDLLWDEPYYLSVTIQGVELTPRTALTYSPYAFAVNKAQEANVAKIVECSGAIGDVKYSILAPTQFAEVNGDCWVPMDGNTNMAGTPLKDLLDAMPNGFLGSNNVPDASGLFLRAHEYSDGVDPDRMPSDNIAQVQLDETIEHTHTFETYTGTQGIERYSNVSSDKTNDGSHSHSLGGALTRHDTESGAYSGLSGEDGQAATISYTTTTGSLHKHRVAGTTNTNNGGTEVRPKNLNLYMYIRIQ